MAGINYDFTTGSLPAGITFARASIGTYTNAAGTLITAGNDVARFNYIAGVSNLLIEPSATNGIPNSNSFDNVAWVTGNGCVVTAAQFISPDGTNNGYSLTSGTTNGYIQQLYTYLNAPYTLSVWVKQITGTAPARLTVGQVVSSALATSTTLTRLSFTATAIAGVAGPVLQVLTAPGSTNGFYGAQQETGSVPTSYIPTTTAAVTRAADSATFTIPAGVNALKYTFDDNSTQVVNVTPGSYTIPTNLSRANIKSIVSTFGYDFTSGSLPTGITFSRASIGTYTNAAGTLITAGNDVARFNYVAGVSNLLIEKSATNMAAQSNNFSTSPWANGGGIVSAQFVSPDGSNNGWSFTGSGTIFQNPQPPFSASTTYTATLWVKRITGVGLIYFGIDNTAASVPTSATLTRLVGTATSGPGGSSTSIFLGTGTDTMGIYGYQLEIGSVPTSYIPTTTATVSRAADSATFTIPAGINQLRFTFDDNSTQAVPVSPGSYTVPTTLNRANIKSIVGTTVPPPNFDFSTGVLPAGITFTRASIGTYVNAVGTLITAGNDVARFNYIGGIANLLIEPSATNLLGQSNNFSDASWSVFNGAVVTAAQFVSPDGANNGWKLSNGAANQGMIEKLFTFSGTTYTMSAWAKQITGTPPLLLSVYGATWVSAPITTTLARYSTVNVNSTQGKGEISVFNSILGNAIGIYGVQLETGSVMTSYIPTTTAAVTRAADSATFIVPVGINQLVYTFDDGSTQTVSVTPGSYTIPTTLARPNIRSIAGRYAFDFTSGSLPAGMTFTRASIGTYFNVSGTLITAGNDVARMNYVGGVSCLLIEPSATNLWLQSNNFTTSPWVPIASPVIAAAQFTGPDGTNSGWSMSGNTAQTYAGLAQTLPLLSNITYIFSNWVKQIAGTGNEGCDINGATGPIIVTSAILTRSSMVIVAPVTATYCEFLTAGGTSVVNGIYGAQLEAGSKMTSYIPTATAAVTRAADAAVLTIPAGVNALLYTFDDNSTQQVSVTSGSYTIPTTLNRPNIKSIQGLSGFDFTSGSLPAGITFTRASIGTYFNSSNILTTASNDVARMNYVSGISCLLIEKSATNMLKQSNNFSNAAWAADGPPVLTSGQFISPDGTNNGWTMASAGFVQCYQTNVTFSATSYVVSVWAKLVAGSGPLVLGFAGMQSNIAIGASLLRVSFTGIAAAGPSVAGLIQLAQVGTAGIYGAQMEVGSVPSSYIPTTTAAVTRAVDQATFTIPTGVTQLTYTFDDNSTQTVSVTPGAYTIPTNLSRPNIKSIAWVTQTTFGAIITLQCAKCGFYMKITNPHDATMIAAKHQAGWGPTHVVSVN